MSKKVRILSLDGGGLRGILSGTVICYLEEKLRSETNSANASIGQYVDMIAGTSTGGILSLVYLSPDENHHYKYDAQKALEVYLDRGDEIFDVNLRQRLRSLGGVRDEKYSAAELEEALNDYFGDTKLSDLLKPCLITSYNIRDRKTMFFTNTKAGDRLKNFYVKDVARATSAAPTYFEPARIKSLYGSPYALIDGGVFANNPALCAYSEARTTDFKALLDREDKPSFPTAKDMVIISVGTGSVKTPYTYPEFKDAGLIKWVRPLIDIMMSGNAETVNYQLRQIFDTLEDESDKADYVRIEPELINGSSEMDDGDVENLKALHEDGLIYVEKNKDFLNEVVQKLLEHA